MPQPGYTPGVQCRNLFMIFLKHIQVWTADNGFVLIHYDSWKARQVLEWFKVTDKPPPVASGPYFLSPTIIWPMINQGKVKELLLYWTWPFSWWLLAEALPEHHSWFKRVVLPKVMHPSQGSLHPTTALWIHTKAESPTPGSNTRNSVPVIFQHDPVL